MSKKAASIYEQQQAVQLEAQHGVALQAKKQGIVYRL